jgi:hypothetical protein
MIVALPLPLFTPDFSDAPQILVMRVVFGLCACVMSDLRTFARWDGAKAAIPPQK